MVNHHGVRQLQRLLLIRLAPENVVARELVLRALQLVRADRLGFEPIELGDESVHRFFRRVTRLHDGDGKKDVGILDEIGAAKRRDGDPLLVHQPLVNP